LDARKFDEFLQETGIQANLVNGPSIDEIIELQSKGIKDKFIY
jgi:hypothetical protein